MIAFICVLVSVFTSTRCFSEVDFDRLHGSDLGMGIGARAIGMGGAFVAIANDASAIFWNPSGLTQVTDNQLFLSVDLPADLSSAVVVYKPTFEKLKDIHFTVGLGLIERLSFKGEGVWKGYSANLLDIAMIDIGDDFSGKIDSHTYDLRLSMAMTPKCFQRISLGINLAYIS